MESVLDWWGRVTGGRRKARNAGTRFCFSAFSGFAKPGEKKSQLQSFRGFGVLSGIKRALGFPARIGR